MQLTIYKPKNANIKQLMVDVRSQVNTTELTGLWIKVDDVRKLIEDKIEYLQSNGLYPSYGLNSQVEALAQLIGFLK